jgi:hypothetical protein
MNNENWKRGCSHLDDILENLKCKDYLALAAQIAAHGRTELSTDVVSARPSVITSSWGQRETDGSIAIVAEARYSSTIFGITLWDTVYAKGFFVTQNGNIKLMTQKDIWQRGY